MPAATVGALTAEQAWQFLGVKKTRLHELLEEHPELDALGVTTLTKRKDGKTYRRWPLDGRKAWLARQSQADLVGFLDDAA